MGEENVVVHKKFLQGKNHAIFGWLAGDSFGIWLVWELVCGWFGWFVGDFGGWRKFYSQCTIFHLLTSALPMDHIKINYLHIFYVRIRVIKNTYTSFGHSRWTNHLFHTKVDREVQLQECTYWSKSFLKTCKPNPPWPLSVSKLSKFSTSFSFGLFANFWNTILSKFTSSFEWNIFVWMFEEYNRNRSTTACINFTSINIGISNCKTRPHINLTKITSRDF